MKAKLSGVQCLAFVLLAPFLLVSCSYGPTVFDKYHNTFVDWPYSLLVAYRDPFHGDEDAELWKVFHQRFHDLLHEERIEYIENAPKRFIYIFVKDEDCQRAMTIINRHVNAGELRVVSWDDMIKQDYFPRRSYVPTQPGIVFGYDYQWTRLWHKCSALGQ